MHHWFAHDVVKGVASQKWQRPARNGMLWRIFAQSMSEVWSVPEIERLGMWLDDADLRAAIKALAAEHARRGHGRREPKEAEAA